MECGLLTHRSRRIGFMALRLKVEPLYAVAELGRGKLGEGGNGSNPYTFFTNSS
jgi:hypothetical protein